jgi:PPOX class probable F420-dependent enzyme
VHPELSSDIIQSFLEQPLLAKLVTLNKDGSPQITFMWYEYNSNGLFLFSTTKQRLKAKNLTRDSRISVAIDDPQNMWRGVIARGLATIDELGAVDLVERLTARYSGKDKVEASKKRAMNEDRIIISMTPIRVMLRGLEK